MQRDADPRSDPRRHLARPARGGGAGLARRCSGCAASSSSAPRIWSIRAPCTRASTTRSGASAVSHRIVAALRREGVDVPRELEDLVGVGALLHDVTHVPFGHTLEDERRLFPRHDKGTRLARAARRRARRRPGAARRSRRDRRPARRRRRRRCRRGRATSSSSTIDADLLDYLRRDTYFAGLAHDYDDRVFRYFTVADGHLALHMSKHGMERPDARSEVIQLLRMRYFLTERVYYHHTKVVAGAMISKAVELALDARRADRERPARAQRLDAARPPAAVAACRRSRRSIERLQRRDLLKRGYVVSARTRRLRGARRARAPLSRVARGRAATPRPALAAALGRPVEDVIIYCPALTVMKEASARVTTSRGLRASTIAAIRPRPRSARSRNATPTCGGSTCSCPPRRQKRAAHAAAELFGHPSEYSAQPVRGGLRPVRARIGVGRPPAGGGHA